MDGKVDQSAHVPPESDPRLASLPGSQWSDLRWLVLLVLMVLGLRAWQLTHTEVISRDSIGFIRIAWQMEQGPLLDAVRASPHHPGYPISILVVSWPVRWFASGNLAELMQLSGQLATALASLLLVFPMYFLGRELAGRRVAFWGTLLFQCLPASGQLMGDALGEPLFLLFATTGLYFAMRGLSTGSALSFSLCGLASGLAYLTRPEGALIALATGLVLLGAQAWRASRKPWGQVWKCGGALAASALVLALPFMAVIGGPTTKLTGKKLLQWGSNASRAQSPESRARTASCPRALDSGLSALDFQGSPLLAAWWFGPEVRPEQRTWWAAYMVVRELVRAFFYLWWFPALVGVWCFRERLRQQAGTWVLLLVSLFLVLLLYAAGRQMGYVSSRHMVLIVLPSCFWAVAGVAILANWLAGRGYRLAGYALTARFWSVGLLLVFMLLPVPRILRTLHADRAGFRQAGCWLAEKARPWDLIVDPYRWSRYYAGHEFLGQQPLQLLGVEPSVCYVVLDHSRSNHPRLLGIDHAQRLAAQGKLIQSWEVLRSGGPASVQVYRVSLAPLLAEEQKPTQED